MKKGKIEKKVEICPLLVRIMPPTLLCIFQLFPINLLFPIDPKVLMHFPRLSRVQIGCRCYWPAFQGLCLLKLHYLSHRILVAKWNYLTVTRLEITYPISVVTQYMPFPMVSHRAIVEQILCYLKGSLGCRILYKHHEHTRIDCFSDADGVGSREHKRSNFGYYVFVGGNLVLWQSKKQHVVSRTSAVSKYRAMT